MIKNKIRQVFSFRTIHSRLFWVYGLLFLCIFVILEIEIYMYNYRNTESLIFDQQSNTCHSINSVIDQQLQNMDSFTKDAIYSSKLKKYLLSHNRLLQNNNSGNDLYLNALYCTDELTSILGFNQDIAQMNVYDSNMNVIGTGEYSGYHYSIKDTIPWTDSFSEAQYDPVIVLHRFEWLENYPNSKKKISVIRKLNNLGAFSYGYVEVTENCADFFRYVQSLDSEGGNFFIFDKDLQCVYPYDPLPDDTNLTLAQQFISGNTASHSQILEKHMITAVCDENSNWISVFIQPCSVITQRLVQLQTIFFLSFALSILLVFILSAFISNILSRPLKELSTQLKNMDFPDVTSPFSTEIHVNSSLDEIQSVTSTLNNMQNKLSRAVTAQIAANAEQVHSQMLAMQNQMNPHFLYNNLTTISIMAEEGMNDKIICLCSDITSMLRYISSPCQNGVPLEEELEHTMEYFNCLKIRYEELISLQVNIPEELLSIIVPKLIIQPLFENIAKYGLDSTPPWNIVIQGTFDEDNWSISVSDNGTGFSQSSLSQLSRQIQVFDETKKVPDLQINGMGLINIYIRMKLFFGDSAIFEIKSTSEGSSILLGASRKYMK